MVGALEEVAHTNTITKLGESIMTDVVELCTILTTEGQNIMKDEVVPDGWKPEQPDLQEGGKDDDINYSARLETKLEQLRMRWAGSNYEIIIDKMEMLESWK